MNRTRHSALVAAVALLALPGSAAAAGGPRDFAVGAAHNVFGHISLSAHSGAGGEDARGHVQARSKPGSPAPFKFGGDVTCLRVEGNRASIFYEFDQAEPDPFQGGGIQIFVEDNGNPVRGQTVDGTATLAPVPGPVVGPPFEGPRDCPPPPPPGSYIRNESGNYVVQNAAP